jgi:lantibiotic leader peptide-processing serine protease
MQRTKRWVFLIIIGLLLAACADQGHVPAELESLARPSQPTDYLISSNRPLSPGFANAVARNSDTLKFLHEDAGFAVVRTANPNAYNRFADTIVRDFRLQWLPDNHTLGIEPMTIGDPPDSGVEDFLFDLQWGHTAVRATHAWNAGFRGQGVRVAVLDTGIDATHPDLSENVNMDLSRSFVPGEDVQTPPGAVLDHGTHVAGIIAAAQNGVGVIGVAPDAEIFAVLG